MVCQTDLRKTRLFEGVKSPSHFAVCEGKNGEPLVALLLGVNECGKQGSVRRVEGSVVLGAEGDGERGKENDRAVVLDLNGMVVGLLPSVVPVVSEYVTVEIDLAFLSCQPEGESPVCF